MAMKKAHLVTFGIIFTLLLFGHFFSFWFVQDFLTSLAPKEDRFSRQYLSWVMKGDAEKSRACLNPSLQAGAKEGLPKITKYLNSFGDLTKLHLLNISNKTAEDNKTRLKQLLYYSDFQKGSFLLKVVLHDGINGFIVDMFHYDLLKQNYEGTMAFDLSGKSLFHYLFLLAVLLMAVFVVVTLVICAMSPVKKKWLWIPAILFGVGKIGLVWNGDSLLDMDFKLKLFSLQLFSVGMSKDPIFQPWVVWISLPLGAILFYCFQMRNIRASAQSFGKNKR